MTFSRRNNVRKIPTNNLSIQINAVIWRTVARSWHKKDSSQSNPCHGHLTWLHRYTGWDGRLTCLNGSLISQLIHIFSIDTKSDWDRTMNLLKIVFFLQILSMNWKSNSYIPVTWHFEFYVRTNIRNHEKSLSFLNFKKINSVERIHCNQES